LERFKQRLEKFSNALERLKEGLTKSADDDLYRDGIPQRFEFTFDLSWKTIKDYMEYQGIIPKIGSPREIIQLGFKQGIISDGEAWIQMMLSRNALSHLYDEKTSREIYGKIKMEYINLFNELKAKFELI